MLGLICLILVSALLFRIAGFLLKILGKILGGILSIAAVFLLIWVAYAMLGTGVLTIPLVLIGGVIVVVGKAIAKTG